jgi:hypothetical protein
MSSLVVSHASGLANTRDVLDGVIAAASDTGVD